MEIFIEQVAVLVSESSQLIEQTCKIINEKEKKVLKM